MGGLGFGFNLSNLIRKNFQNQILDYYNSLHNRLLFYQILFEGKLNPI